MTQVYVYEGKEVFLTGRTATKKSTRRGSSSRTLYEIKPIKYINSNTTMTGIEDWVRMQDLYEINTEESKENNNDQND